jgi:HEAT repeat protein
MEFVRTDRRGGTIRRGGGVVFYCPNCWSQLQEWEKICSQCGRDIEPLDRQGYFEKLIRALHHPEPTTRIRAAYILGELGDRRAIPPFLRAMKQARNLSDLFFIREMALALGKIGGEEALRPLVHLMDHPSVLIRESALRSLAKISRPEATARIRQALQDPSPAIQALAQKIVKNLGDGARHDQSSRSD